MILVVTEFTVLDWLTKSPIILKKSRNVQGPPQRQASDAIQRKLEQALALLQRGKLLDAKTMYEEILRQRPDHFDALHLLGIVACQTKNPLQGEELFGKAIKIKPNVAEAHNNHGI